MVCDLGYIDSPGFATLVILTRRVLRPLVYWLNGACDLGYIYSKGFATLGILNSRACDLGYIDSTGFATSGILTRQGFQPRVY